MSRRLHVEAWGAPASPHVVYLHGVTGHGRNAEALAQGWLGDYRVLAPDLLGHGSSPHEPPWSIGDQVAAIVETVGSTPATWIGHSYGGRIALELAALHAELVERLVLLDPAILLDPMIALHVAESARADRSYGSFDEGITRRYEESVLQDVPRALIESDLRGFLVEDDDGRWRYRYSQAAVIASYGEMASEPPAFESVRIPTLLVLGRRSFVTYDHLIDAHRAALGAQLTVVTVDGGHTLLWDAPEETAAAIVAFLAQ